MKESIQRIGKEIEEVISQGEKAEKEVNKKIDEIKIEIETRRVQLLEEIEKKREEKIKRLRNQKDELEMNQVGLETCLIFGNNLINLGNGIEISLSKDYFLKRITNLKNEKIQFDSICDSLIIFESTSSLSQLLNAISSFGSIIDQDISPKHSFISLINIISPSSLPNNQSTNIFTSNSPSSKFNQTGKEKELMIKIGENEKIEIGITCCDSKGIQFDKKPVAAGTGMFDIIVQPPHSLVILCFLLFSFVLFTTVSLSLLILLFTHFHFGLFLHSYFTFSMNAPPILNLKSTQITQK